MSFEEHAEVVEPRVRHDVDNQPAAGQVDADGKALGEVLTIFESLADGDVRQVGGRDSRQRRQVRGLFLRRSPADTRSGSSTSGGHLAGASRVSKHSLKVDRQTPTQLVHGISHVRIRTGRGRCQNFVMRSGLCVPPLL